MKSTRITPSQFLHLLQSIRADQYQALGAMVLRGQPDHGLFVVDDAPGPDGLLTVKPLPASACVLAICLRRHDRLAAEAYRLGYRRVAPPPKKPWRR